MLTLITIPSATTTLETLGSYSSPIFDELLLPALVVVGMSLGIGILVFIWHGLEDAFENLTNRSGGNYDIDDIDDIRRKRKAYELFNKKYNDHKYWS